jgi:hypothetical protein
VVRNHRIGPPGHGLISVPIREHCVTGPDGSNILAAVRIVQEDTTVIAISVDAVVVAGVVGVGNIDGRINDTSCMLVLRLVRGFFLATHGM